ncbi:hypothetical protein [Ruminococcus sp. YE71]|uniref:hypothetical protein n=1 Tax=Ruminococcus sp. YE71 TaxID=244362 RepID=UPI0011135E81|nr:hypothetical protein [Ruminococcus sp. YE71]
MGFTTFYAEEIAAVNPSPTAVTSDRLRIIPRRDRFRIRRRATVVSTVQKLVERLPKPLPVPSLQFYGENAQHDDCGSKQ